jgi:hypothetical protein
MFYARINKIKVFNNREGFLGLFNSAEMRIYGYAAGYAGTGQPSDLTLGDLAALPDDASRRELLLQRTATEINRFTQSACLEIDGVKDNQDLTFGDAGLVIYQHETIPDTLLMQLWVIESDADIRLLTADADALLDSDEFRAVLTAVNAMLIAANPVLGTVIGVGRVAVSLLRKKLRANRDDLAGWQATLNRAEHYLYGTRDRLDVPDTTGNIRVDYTLFGFNRIENGELRMENDGSVMTDAVPSTANGVKQSPAPASVPENTPAQAPSSTQPSPPLWGGVGGEVKTPAAPSENTAPDGDAEIASCLAIVKVN